MSLVEKFRDAFSTTDERLDFLNATMLRILAALGGEPVPPSGELPPATTVLAYPKNKPSFATGSKTVITAGTAVQLTEYSLPIEDGYELAVVAHPGNSGTIYIGASKGDAEGSNKFDGLNAGIAVSMRIKDTNLIWVNAETSSDGVSWVIEK